MCGIFGSVSDRVKYSVIKEGLENLAYRGYDSAGIAIASDTGVKVFKTEGHPKNLPDQHETGNSAIGHNRWATHSLPTKENSHPYTSNNGKIFLVHNGIIENYSELKDKLSKKGFKFYSETDTEVLPNLLQMYLEKGHDIVSAMSQASKNIVGAYGVIFIHKDYPQQLNIMKLGSPIYIGKTQNGVFVCSDAYSFPTEVEQISSIDDNKIVILKKDNIVVKDVDGNSLSLMFEDKSDVVEEYSLGQYKHYMEKEIFEQYDYSIASIAGRIKNFDITLGGLIECFESITKARQIIFTGCGSAYNASLIGTLAMEEIGKVLSRSMPSGELKYSKPIIDNETWSIVVSQSGETADAIGCIKNLKEKGAKVLGIVNVPNSTIYKMTDCGIHIRAGKEVSVASTKAVTNQIIANLLLAYKVGLENGCTYKEYKEFCTQMQQLPQRIKNILSLYEDIKKTSSIYGTYENAFVIGRGVLEPIAKEIALKIKEISYIHAEGYSGSELKHGPLALIDSKIMNICLLDKHDNPHKTLSNIEEIKARSGNVLLITNFSKEETNSKIYDNIISIGTGDNKFINSILFNIVGQIISYNLAYVRGKSIDLPRNLAKSVTVE